MKDQIQPEVEPQPLPATPDDSESAAVFESTQNAHEDDSDSTAEPLALPEAELREPPRPLVAGAFLGGEFEVKELLARGLTNYYMAYGGDYSSPEPKFVAEREVQDEVAAPTEAPLLQSPLFPPARFVSTGDREYLIFDWIESLPLQDWREPTNDARYLQTLSTLAVGMLDLQSRNLMADFSRETLRFDAGGQLKYFGFVDAVPENQEPAAGLELLRSLNTFLLRQVFAEAATIRLDDDTGIFPDVDLSRFDAGRYVSRKHATIKRQGTQFFLTPHKTLNPSRVDGFAVAEGATVPIENNVRLEFAGFGL